MSLQREINGHFYELLPKAREFQVSLFCDGKGVRSWWEVRFENNPDLDHPFVQQAISDHERMLEKFPNWSDRRVL